jgi:hypothetical protein
MDTNHIETRIKASRERDSTKGSLAGLDSGFPRKSTALARFLAVSRKGVPRAHLSRCVSFHAAESREVA